MLLRSRFAVALLLPLETMGAKWANRLFRAQGVTVIPLTLRVNYKMYGHLWSESSSWLDTAWFTWRLLPAEMGSLRFYEFDPHERARLTPMDNAIPPRQWGSSLPMPAQPTGEFGQSAFDFFAPQPFPTRGTLYEYQPVIAPPHPTQAAFLDEVTP
jgi:hypothetical protein